jgi:hypothetical protein
LIDCAFCHPKWVLSKKYIARGDALNRACSKIEHQPAVFIYAFKPAGKRAIRQVDCNLLADPACCGPPLCNNFCNVLAAASA